MLPYPQLHGNSDTKICKHASFALRNAKEIAELHALAGDDEVFA
jgi:hypothetical protein